MKRILIVGASSGIGAALASHLKDSCSVVSISRRRPAGTIQEHYYYDVRSGGDPPGIDGPIDGLVYCPGSVILKPFRMISDEQYRDDMEINFIGAVRVVRHYLPSLQRSGNAAIVLFSSVAASAGMVFHTSISASKAALEGWMRSLAAELAPNIRVNAVAPSLVQTPMTNRFTDSDAKLKVAENRHPLKRIGQSGEIACLTAFLLSDNAAYITGQVFHADGGILAIRN